MTTINSAGLDSNDVVMTYAKEATWGVKPSVPFQTLRLDGEGFSSTKSRTRPSEVNASGQASAAITTKIESTGSLNASISAGTFNDFLASAIGGAFKHPAYVPASNTIALTATSITDSANGFLTGLGLTATSGNYVVKLTIMGTGINTSLNGSTYLVSATAAGALTCTVLTGPAMAVVANTVIGTCKLEVISIAKAATATLSATATGFSDTASKFVENGFEAGMMIRVSGFPLNAGNNKYYRVTSVTAGAIVTVPTPTVEVASAAVSIQGNMCRNGVVFDSFFVQKFLATGKYLQYEGAFPTGGSLDAGVGSYLKGSFTFMNQAESKAVVDGSTGTAISPTTGVVIDSITGVGTPQRGNALGTTLTDVAAKVQKISIKFDKTGAAAQFAMGSSGAVGMRKGTFTASGTLSTYFADFTLYDEFINDTAGSMGFPAVDATGAGYYITFCRATIQNPKIVCGGPGQDVVADFEIEGNPDTTGVYGYKTLQIDYFGM